MANYIKSDFVVRKFLKNILLLTIMVNEIAIYFYNQFCIILFNSYFNLLCFALTKSFNLLSKVVVLLANIDFISTTTETLLKHVILKQQKTFLKPFKYLFIKFNILKLCLILLVVVLFFLQYKFVLSNS